jgi:hypothetical protein
MVEEELSKNIQDNDLLLAGIQENIVGVDNIINDTIGLAASPILSSANNSTEFADSIGFAANPIVSLEANYRNSIFKFEINNNNTISLIIGENSTVIFEFELISHAGGGNEELSYIISNL